MCVEVGDKITGKWDSWFPGKVMHLIRCVGSYLEAFTKTVSPVLRGESTSSKKRKLRP